MISFGRDTGYELRIGETEEQAVLRLIAAQLVPEGTIKNELDAYIEAAIYSTTPPTPFVLMIDDLDSLCYPMKEAPARLLRQMFLDKPFRRLVFSSRIPMNVDCPVAMSKGFLGAMRGVRLVELSTCNSLADHERSSIPSRQAETIPSTPSA